MRRVVVAVGLIAAVSCGRTDLDREAPIVARDPFCSDATLAGAATPMQGYCTDGSKRAPTLAPLHPLVAWTVPASLRNVVVDDEGTLFGNGVAVSADGRVRANAMAFDPSFLSASGDVVGSAVGGGLVIATRDGTNRVDRSSPYPDPSTWHVRLRVPTSDPNAIGVLVEHWGGWNSTLGRIEREDRSGNTAWSAATECALDDIDGAKPNGSATLRDGRIAVACAATHGGLAVFSPDGALQRADRFDGEELVAAPAVTPTGELLMVSRTSQPGTMLRALREGSAIWTATLPSTDEVGQLAVARDGTVLYRTRDRLFALDRNGAWLWDVAAPAVDLYWNVASFSTARIFVDAADTVVVWGPSSLEARDLATGALRWSLAPPDTTAYASFETVTAAGPRALYATGSFGVAMIRDP